MAEKNITNRSKAKTSGEPGEPVNEPMRIEINSKVSILLAWTNKVYPALTKIMSNDK